MKSFPSSQSGPILAQSACSAASDFLRSHEKMASLLPAAARLAALQQDCRKALPQLFETCAVLKMEEGMLTLSAPNAAIAARLKQKLPSLTEKLAQGGWRIESARVKVQMKPLSTDAPAPRKKTLPRQAVSSLAELHQQIAGSGNKELAEALASMLAHHKGRK